MSFRGTEIEISREEVYEAIERKLTDFESTKVMFYLETEINDFIDEKLAELKDIEDELI